MRIGFVCKRRYMGKDVIADRYARLYEIPAHLAALGHDVTAVCLSYHGDQAGCWRHETPAGSLQWVARRLDPLVVPGIWRHARATLELMRAQRIELVVGASDAAHVVFGAWLAAQLSVPYAADLYDDFESFGMARLPGLVPAYRRAVRDAALVSCTSAALAAHVRQAYGARGVVLTLPSTVDLQAFKPRDRAACRATFGLPPDAHIIGTAGGLHLDKGIGTLYEAFDRLSREDDTLHLAVAGPRNASSPPPSGKRVHDLGELPHARVAELFGALDVGVVYLRNTRFGRFCFPQKAYEMAACGTPLVAAAVGAMPALLAAAPQTLYRPDDASDLARAIRAQLAAPCQTIGVVEDWSGLVSRLEAEIARLPREGQRGR
jgi:glycosyltransferase involved in cell wall biosynthesis